MDIDNANCKNRVSECLDIEALTIDRPIKIEKEITNLDKLIEELHVVFSRDHVNIHDVQKLMAGYKSNVKDWRKYAKFDRFRYTRNLVDAGNGAFNIMILCWGGGHASAIHDHADSHCFMKLLAGSLEEVRYNWPDNVEPEVMKKLRNKPRRCCSESDKANGTTDCGSCQNERCQNYGGKIDSPCDNSPQNGGQDADQDDDQNGNERCYDSQNMVETGRTKLEVDDVCYINDALGLHRMENPSHVDGAVSLHLYCPPFDACRVFDARTGRPTPVTVTFWSKYGKKVKHVSSFVLYSGSIIGHIVTYHQVIESNNIADSQ